MAKPKYVDLAQLADSILFNQKCTIAVANYARFIINENPATQNHQRRYGWATTAIQSPSSTAAALRFAIAMDPVFADQDPPNFDATPDSGAASVQVAVEATINSTVLTF